MNDTDSLIKILIDFAERNENCFDDYIKEHCVDLINLNEFQLVHFILMREKCAKISAITSFTRDELDELVDSGVFEANGVFLEISNGFNIADSFFGL